MKKSYAVAAGVLAAALLTSSCAVKADTDMNKFASDLVDEAQWRAALAPENFENVTLKWTRKYNYAFAAQVKKHTDVLISYKDATRVRVDYSQKGFDFQTTDEIDTKVTVCYESAAQGSVQYTSAENGGWEREELEEDIVAQTHDEITGLIDCFDEFEYVPAYRGYTVKADAQCDHQRKNFDDYYFKFSNGKLVGIWVYIADEWGDVSVNAVFYDYGSTTVSFPQDLISE